jgi:hypothetical protein
MYRFKTILAVAVMLLTLPAVAQQDAASTPRSARDEQIRKMMQPTMNPSVNAAAAMMVPATEAIIEAELNLAAMPETAQRIASFKRNLFDALRKTGFTAEQAFQLTLTTALPSASPAGK